MGDDRPPLMVELEDWDSWTHLHRQTSLCGEDCVPAVICPTCQGHRSADGVACPTCGGVGGVPDLDQLGLDLYGEEPDRVPWRRSEDITPKECYL